tara:strand:- start:16 stop:405 length:390 start_codon:yes stop_codon:yes gene_type:complete
MNKVDLEVKIESLRTMVQETKADSDRYSDQLAEVEKQLEDLNKPEITPAQLDAIYLAVEKGVEEFDFSDTDNFDIEYGIEYDGKVHCETHEINNTTDLVESICDKVARLFKEADLPETEECESTVTKAS